MEFGVVIVENIYQHFRIDERQLIDKVVEWKETVLNQYSPKLTDFLDPREQEIAKAVIGEKGEVKIALFGGTANTERKRALIFPDYYEEEENDFQMKLFEIEYPSKFVTIEHRQVLGSLMSLGLDRSKFGDIRFASEQIHLVVATEIADYLRMNFQEVGRAKISLKELSFDQMIAHEEDVQEMSTTVSSLRLDVVVAAINNLSRAKVQTLIKHGLVKINWKTVDDPSFEVQEGDTLSVRGYGRSKFLSIEGKTKKDKLRVVINKQK
ncbi:RNA-binding protein [Metabacillus fastidiosus]|uniref:RNA-binding protein n=1 Tax=Metabacillus fastidiosus TaxID=1458 RepID=A0ABU6NZI1_9BACI|nr:RNA-binding protein [Metabacillus fastidiosus]MED4401649.1 RNA-binding protein [Metabacillus fastidiosus]